MNDRLHRHYIGHVAEFSRKVLNYMLPFFDGHITVLPRDVLQIMDVFVPNVLRFRIFFFNLIFNIVKSLAF
jgi:hypothetical protein